MNNIAETETGKVQQEELREVLKPYLKKWKWFVVSAFTVALLTFIYLKTVPSAYKITSTVLVKETSNMGGEFAALSSISGMGKMGSDVVDNEVLVFQSKRLMTSVIRELGLETNIYQPGFFRDTELYKTSSPIVVKVLSEKKDAEFLKKPIKLVISGNTFILTSSELKKDVVGTFNRTVSLPFANIMVMKNPHYDISKTDKKYQDKLLISIAPLDVAVENYQKMLGADLANKDVTVIELSMNYPEREKAKDIINKLVANYNRDALQDKNQESQKTAEFIEERIVEIGKELGSVEDQKERFKEQNKIVDIATEATLGLQLNAEAKKRLTDVENQIDMSTALLDFISRQGNEQVLPANTGLDNGGTSSAIAAYNGLIVERSRLLQNATGQNPLVQELNKQIRAAKTSIVESIVKAREGLNLTKNNILREQGRISNQVAKVPAQEKLFRNIERQQEIKESLYLLLLKKREENNITLAMTGEKGRVIDYAYSSQKPVSPKKMLILLAGFIVGALLPAAYIYIKELMNDKIVTRTELEKLSGGRPVIGEVPSLKKKQSEIIEKNDLSPMAEAFRIIYTNLSYMLPKSDIGHVILVTSSVKGEGKTFVSVNLALTVASPKRKAVIVGSDIRNPQLQRYNPASKSYKGLTEYLHDPDVKVEDIKFKSQYNPNLDVIFSGSIPPNPTDLLSNGRYEGLVKMLQKEYDYVILDTAPLMLVTDTFLIAHVADLTLYVTRSKVTERTLINFAVGNIEAEKIKNTAFVLNDVAEDAQGYGKYGYGYGTNKVSWWKKLLGN